MVALRGYGAIVTIARYGVSSRVSRLTLATRVGGGVAAAGAVSVAVFLLVFG